MNHAALLAMGMGRVDLGVGSRWEDYFPHVGAVATFRVVRELAKRLGMGTRMWHFHCEGPHGLGAATRQAQTDWMKARILGEGEVKGVESYWCKDEGVKELPFEAGAAFFTEGHQVRELAGFRSVYEILAARAAELKAKREKRGKRTREDLRKEIAAARQKWEGNGARLDYLKGLELALEGIEARARKCAAACREAAEKEADVARKGVLEEMAARCERVPILGARTFREGVQSIFFCFDFLPDAIGRLDQYLKGLYFADLEAGRITREEARDCLQELFIFIDAHTSHWSRNYDKGGECHMTVGGLNRDGSDGWTDFSRLVVEAAMGCDLKRPQMSFRWHEGTAREVLKFMLDCERRDPNMRIAFDGDVKRVPMLARRLGISIEQARDYCITGCNEPTFMGGVSFGGFHINALRCMERVFTVRRVRRVVGRRGNAR